MSVFSKFVPFGWILHLGVCFYLIRPIRNMLSRALLTIIPCTMLTLIGCRNLPLFQMSSVMTISLCWMISIRLTDLIVFSSDESLSFRLFIGKFLWFVFPLVESKSKYPIIVDIGSAYFKLLLNHWIYRCFVNCEANDSYMQMIMFYLWICTSTYVADAQIALVRLLTRKSYTFLSFNDFPFLSRSIREFWGHRYNSIVGSLLRESVFRPLRHVFSFSPTIAALITFSLSGLLHVHIAATAFAASSLWPPFTFFLLQGVACCAESISSITLWRPIGIAITHIFLLLTSPLYIGLFTRAGPAYFSLNEPLFFNAKWIPQLPVPVVLRK